MPFTADSPLATKVVESPSSEVGRRFGGISDIKGIAIHMAEGGGTVSWLKRLDGNSSHYVVEYGSRIVQMVRERDWAGSINPRNIRMTTDEPFTFMGESVVYGRRSAVNAIGKVAADNPNRYLIAIETEGFAVVGPNAAQRVALRKLVADIRKRYGPLPVLGHRDFQDWKRCPGRKIPWADYGGHANRKPVVPSLPDTSTEVTTMRSFKVPEERTLVWLKDLASVPGDQSRWLYSNSDFIKDGKEISLDPRRPLNLVGFDAETYIVAYEPTGNDADDTSDAMFAKASAIERTEVAPDPAPAPPADDTTPYDENDLQQARGEAHAIGFDAGEAAEKERLSDFLGLT
ncbi:MAG: N-acetylmuramoyl-L-alanine amidase [Trueperaceae bacterium]|nr:N-acetylmuramoyl-L-alanine amidase [Trueperaceae bacterium]